MSVPKSTWCFAAGSAAWSLKFFKWNTNTFTHARTNTHAYSRCTGMGYWSSQTEWLLQNHQKYYFLPTTIITGNLSLLQRAQSSSERHIHYTWHEKNSPLQQQQRLESHRGKIDRSEQLLHVDCTPPSLGGNPIDNTLTLAYGERDQLKPCRGHPMAQWANGADHMLVTSWDQIFVVCLFSLFRKIILKRKLNWHTIYDEAR